jgi:hypothetical protein
MEDLYYIPNTGQVFNALQLQNLFGINPDNFALEILNQFGVFPVTQTVPTADGALYTSSATYVVDGNYAIQTWVYTPVDLPLAKDLSSSEVKSRYNEEAIALVSSSGVDLDIWTGSASQDPGDRPPVYNTLLGAMATIGDTLAAKLTAIDSATTVDEINNIVNPPSGIFNTGRGLAGSEDMNPSYFVELNSISLTPADMEIYVPGTMTVIPYDSFLPPPYTFDSLGNCFNPGDYVIQIRVAATSEVVAEFEVPLNEYNEDVSF